MTRRLGSLAAAALALGLAACSKEGGLAGVRLPTLASPIPASLAACPTSKCLTVVVAPWCPYCRSSTPLIQAFRRRLAGRGVASRVVVGQDSPQAVEAYAREFGPDVFLDVEGRVRVSGVPHFIVSDAAGRVLKSVAGAPRLEPPWTPELLDSLAAAYGLP